MLKKIINFVKKLGISYLSIIFYFVVIVAFTVSFCADYNKSWLVALILVLLLMFFSKVIGNGIDSLEKLGSPAYPSVVYFLAIVFFAITLSMNFSYINMALVSIFLAFYTLYIVAYFLVYTCLDREDKMDFFSSIALVMILNIGLLSYS